MSLSEFALIERYFRKAGAMRSDVLVGVGDDAAILQCPAGSELVAAIDTLVEGVHFPHGSPAASIGHRVLAVVRGSADEVQVGGFGDHGHHQPVD